MARFFCLLTSLLLLFIGSLTAQSSVDSLRAALAKAKGQKRFEIYAQLGKSYRESHPDSSVYFGKLLLKEAKNDPVYLAEGHSLVGVAYRIQGNHRGSVIELQKAINIYLKLADTAALSAAYSNLGTAYFFSNDLKTSLKYQIKALRLKEKLGQKNGIASVLLNIGNIYIQQEDFVLAREHYQRAFQLFTETNNLQGISYSLNNLGVIDEHLGNYESALTDYLEALKIDELLDDRYAMASSYHNIAEIYYKTGKKALAKDFYSKTLSLAKSVGDLTRVTTSLAILAEFEREKGHLNEALSLSQEALDNARTIKFPTLIMEALRSHIRSLAMAKRYEEAYLLSEELMEIKDIIAKEDKNKELKEAQSAYASDRKNQKIELLQKDKALQAALIKRQKFNQKVYIGAILVVLVLLFFIINRYKLIQKNESLLQRLNSSLENKVHERTKDLQFALERAEKADKLKTFFLSNINQELRTPMNGIIGMANYLEDNLSDPETKQLAKNLLQNSKRLSDTLTAVIELSALEASGEMIHWETIDLIALVRETMTHQQEMAENKGLKLKMVHYADQLFVQADRKILGRILDHLLHNAIKFTETGEVQLEINRQIDEKQRFIEVRIRDTGLGIAKENLDNIFEAFRKGDDILYRGYEGLGIGLTLARKYTQLLDGQLSVDSEPGRGTQFTIRLHETQA
jgi:signal transduction histidine kinase/tetratricopeptide (TPR) repeat protein